MTRFSVIIRIGCGSTVDLILRILTILEKSRFVYSKKYTKPIYSQATKT